LTRGFQPILTTLGSAVELVSMADRTLVVGQEDWVLDMEGLREAGEVGDDETGWQDQTKQVNQEVEN